MKVQNMLLVILSVLTLVLSGCGQGPVGPAGATGATGAQGPKGDQGASGNNGSNGSNGTSCSVSTVAPNQDTLAGGALISCTDGSFSLIVNGTNGKDATNPAPVQFCPNDVPSYPSVFAEVGFCLGAKMYGVYSANGGFLTYLPPGAYSSAGIGSSCNFTINDDCTVSN